jgi:D-alanyl-D-alanine carboxypeptidase (penicillin-binding protein 5/6)
MQIYRDINYRDIKYHCNIYFNDTILEYENINKMKKKFIIIAFLFIFLTPICVSAQEEDNTQDNITLHAQAAVLMDADTGRVLYEKNGYDILPMASTTKIMTLILALENANTEDTVTVSGYAASMPQVRLGMKKGEEYRLNDLLYSLMLESHNDSAVAIAEHVSGSVEGFADLMNGKAAEIGCEDTYYITPNGLDAQEDEKIHSTTARDLALVMSYCIKESSAKEEFLKITQTRSYSFTDISGKRNFSCTNHNSFLDMMDGALSGKTGYTGNAGYCYVGALESEGRTFVVALLACGWPNNKTYKWSDTKALMKYGMDNYKYRLFEETPIPDEVYNSVCVTNAVTESFEKIGNLGIIAREDENVEVIVHRMHSLSAPIKSGTIVGYVSYCVDKGEWLRQNIVISQNIEAIDVKWCVMKIFKQWLIKK